MSGAALDARVVVQRPGFRLEAELHAEPGEVIAVMGPSGAGKSTLLGVLAGLVRLDDGHVRLGDRDLDRTARPRVRTDPASRSIVMLGQEPRLFPHLSAHENVAFGMRVRGMPKAAADSEADEWLWRVGLAGVGARRPSKLSGGQQQRVALARALATKPAALLLDEPLTSLDTEIAGDVRALLHDQLTATHTTAVVATHDAVDAVSLARRLIVLENGRVTQTGPVRDVLAAPATRFTAAVAGLNRVVGSMQGSHWVHSPLAIAAGDAASVHSDGTALAAVFRPSAVGITDVVADTWTGALKLESIPGDGEWLARVTRLEQTPAGVRVRTADPEVAVDLTADRAAELGIAPGVPVRLKIAASDVRLLEVGPGPS
jgi:molybdate transport system ATP-binding protein